MKEPEIVLNLWFVQDSDGVIFSLRARAYVAFGSDDEKAEMLRRFAGIDYLIARPFPIPEAFHVLLAESHTRMPVAYRQALDLMNGPLDIFEEAIQALNNGIPAQTELEVPHSPLVCITTLIGDDAGRVQPVVEGARRL
jgi:hypothetical protein